MVQIIRKLSLPIPSDLPERLRAVAAEALTVKLREPKPLGSPLLFSAGMSLIEPATQYLHEHGVQRGHRKETIRTYAEILYDWFETLEQNEIKWNEADAVDLVAYRNRMIREPSGHTKRAYLRSTINHRVRGVLRFYDWAVQMGWLSESPLCAAAGRFNVGTEVVSDKYAEGPEREHSFFVLRQFSSLPSPYSASELREMFAFLAPPYRLIARWQLYTGLRIAEVLNLGLEQLRPAEENSFGTITVNRKGGKYGDVIVPGHLLDETKAYVCSYRLAWARRATNAGRTGDSTALFLNSRGSRVGRSAYQRAIRASGEVIGRRATSHALRATFACMMLASLEGAANNGAAINPLLIVKVMMGHEHIETTDRYLRAIAVDRSAIKEALDSLIKDELA